MLLSSFRPFLFGVALLTLSGAFAVGQDDPGRPSTQSLFVDALEWEDPGLATNATIIRGRPVRIDVMRLTDVGRQPGDTLEFELFDDASYKGVVERVDARSAQSLTLIGRLAEEAYSGFTLVVADGVVVANIRPASSQSYYQIRYLGQGVHVVREIDENAFPPCGVSPYMEVSGEAQPPPDRGPGRSCDDDGSVIDVLVVYSPAARMAAGGTEAMNALIDLAIVESNTAYLNSLIDTELRMVYKTEVEYYEVGTFYDHLNRLTDPADGYIDEVHTLRNLYRADMVTMLVEDTYYCGMAWVMTTLSPDFEAHAFSVTSQMCATGSYTFAHELGHNQGCAHDRANASVPGVFDYSYGYQEPNELFRTVMAYNCPGGCPRIQHFSNPDVDYMDLPTGVPVGEPDAAHNALSINNTALTVANFRKYWDCNDNGVCDDEDIAAGTSHDCNDNGLPDECETDCNGNGIADECDVSEGTSEDCNDNGIPDECLDLEADCNDNQVPDECDIANGTSQDQDGNGVPDECQWRLFVRADAPPGGTGYSWSLAFNDLQIALTALPDYGGEIWVAAGTYKPAGPGGDIFTPFDLRDYVRVYGGFAGGESSLDERDIEANETILSGDLNGDDGPGAAGGDSDCCNARGTPGCEFDTCEAVVCAERDECCTSRWDEICVSFATRLCCDICTTCDNSLHVLTASYGNASAVLDGFTITAGNASNPTCPYSTGFGGAMLNDHCSPTVRNCLFLENRAHFRGGAIANEASSPVLKNCVFKNNSVHHGGAISNYTDSSPLLINCSFIGNSATWDGGAVLIETGSPTFINCDFRGNSAYYEGGALEGGEDITFIGCLFSGNYAGLDGGAIRSRDSVLTNCTVSANCSGLHGGGVYNNGYTAVANCILWGNSGLDGASSGYSSQFYSYSSSVTYSCIQGSSTGSYCGDGPLFIDPDGEDNIVGTEDDNLRIPLNSPCIDAGDNEAVPPDVTTDLDGITRFLDVPGVPDTGNGTPPIVDMGAYEFYFDCNGNHVPDCEDLASGTSEDCNENTLPDECDIADGTCKDCNHNGVPDQCDLAEGASEDLNGNGVPDECDGHTPWPEDSFGMSCENDDQCEGATTCIHGVCYAPKNRYISITVSPENGGNATARRISLETTGLQTVVLGWVGEPTFNPIEGILTAVVSDFPVYNMIDFHGGWPGVLHVAGCQIAPERTYLIQAIASEQSIDDESNYPEPLALPTSPVWGDVVSACPHGICSPPEGDPFTQPNIDDVLALVNAFQGVDNAPLTWLDIDPVAGDGYPEGMVVIGDVLAVVLAFQGEPYPGDGPLGCP
jgi:predicted outer membrane repeat protein